MKHNNTQEEIGKTGVIFGTFAGGVTIKARKIPHQTPCGNPSVTNF